MHRRAFTLIELLLVVVLLIGISSAVIVSLNTNNAKERFEYAKDQFKNYLSYNKYKSIGSQSNVNVGIDVENGVISSPMDFELDWILDFTNDISIIDSSTTNVVFNLDGSVNQEITIDVRSTDGVYSNRLYVSPIGTLTYKEIPQTKVDEKNEDFP